MIKPDRYFIYTDAADQVVRLAKVKGTWYYCVRDICKALNMIRPRSTLSRLLIDESLKISFDGCCYRCVSATGLLAVVPQNRDQGKARKYIVNLIRFAEAQPGKPLFEEKENRKYFTVGKGSVLVIVDENCQPWFCRFHLSRALCWNWLDYWEFISVKEIRQFDITTLDSGKEQTIKAKFLSATGLIALTPRGESCYGRRTEIVKLICEADSLANEIKNDHNLNRCHG